MLYVTTHLLPPSWCGIFSATGQHKQRRWIAHCDITRLHVARNFAINVYDIRQPLIYSVVWPIPSLVVAYI